MDLQNIDTDFYEIYIISTYVCITFADTERRVKNNTETKGILLFA